MRVHLSPDASLVHATEKLRQALTSLSTGFGAALCEWAYRPEQHYMRGPGPKCRKLTSMAESRSGALPACMRTHSQGYSQIEPRGSQRDRRTAG